MLTGVSTELFKRGCA